MENMGILDRFANPEMLEQMTFGEKLMASSYVALLGMIVTFVALMIIWGLILTMTKLVGEAQQKKAVQITKVPTPKVIVEEAKENQEELIAVITAAVAASMNTSTHNIVVRNIVRIPDTTPAWGVAGRAEQMSRMM